MTKSMKKYRLHFRRALIASMMWFTGGAALVSTAEASPWILSSKIHGSNSSTQLVDPARRPSNPIQANPIQSGP